MTLLAHLHRHGPQRFALALIMGYALTVQALLLGLALGASAQAATFPATQISCLGHSIPGQGPASDPAQHGLDASCVKACFGAVADIDDIEAHGRSAPELRIVQSIAAADHVACIALGRPSARGPPEA